MCGVVGALGDADVTRAVERLKHRGIRNTTALCTAGSIGHVRLPIVGLGEEHDQPCYGEGWLFGFVGELLNFRERYPDMACDTELAFKTWTGLGPPGFTTFDGFWGIVAIHEASKSLHVLTDYLGIKPMYYRTDLPAAASEIDALLVFGEVTLDEVYLSAVQKWGYCPDTARTPYNEIKHLLPGHHAILQRDKEPLVHETDPLFPTEPLGSGKDAFRDAIEAAVMRRVLSSDVQTACLVSGGLDSAIVWTLAERYGQPVAYNATENKDDDEDYWLGLQVVRQKFVASHGLDGSPAMTNPPALRRIHYGGVSIQEALHVMQEPIDLGSLRPQIALAMGIKERVCLTGDGADELFGGYGRYMLYDAQRTDIYHELFAWHLPRLDRTMMRNRVEVRSPFLARRVVELAMGLPYELRRDKSFLRGLFADIISPRICEMKKKPLRIAEIENDPQPRRIELVRMFRDERHWLR